MVCSVSGSIGNMGEESYRKEIIERFRWYCSDRKLNIEREIIYAGWDWSCSVDTLEKLERAKSAAEEYLKGEMVYDAFLDIVEEVGMLREFAELLSEN